MISHNEVTEAFRLRDGSNTNMNQLIASAGEHGQQTIATFQAEGLTLDEAECLAGTRLQSGLDARALDLEIVKKNYPSVFIGIRRLKILPHVHAVPAEISRDIDVRKELDVILGLPGFEMRTGIFLENMGLYPLSGDEKSGYLTGLVKNEGKSALRALAYYAGRVKQELGDCLSVKALLGQIDQDRSLPLFGELGENYSPNEEQLASLGETSPSTTAGIQQVRYVGSLPGICPALDSKHLASLFQSAALRKPAARPILIALDGEIIGLLKRVGDHSMLSLKTIRTDSGLIPLVTGGVYGLRSEIREQAFEAAAEQPDLGMPVLALKSAEDTLAVRPLRFIGSDPYAKDGWSRTCHIVQAIRAKANRMQAAYAAGDDKAFALACEPSPEDSLFYQQCNVG